MATDYKASRAALRSSHEQLVKTVTGLSPTDVEAASYCSDWNIAQVLSHMGSGGEIFLMLFTSALAGLPPVGGEAFQPVWAKWNARSPLEVRDTVIAADGIFLEALESASDSVLDDFQIAMFGHDRDAAGFILMRLGEHILHSWDVEVIGEPSRGLLPAGVEQLIDVSPTLAGRFAHGERPEFKGRLEVKTTGPERRFGLDLSGEEVVLSADVEAGEGLLELPAESLIRLLYGRLDAAHTPASVAISGPVSLDELRALFPGF